MYLGWFQGIMFVYMIDESIDFDMAYGLTPQLQPAEIHDYFPASILASGVPCSRRSLEIISLAPTPE